MRTGRPLRARARHQRAHGARVGVVQQTDAARVSARRAQDGHAHDGLARSDSIAAFTLPCRTSTVWLSTVSYPSRHSRDPYSAGAQPCRQHEGPPRLQPGHAVRPLGEGVTVGGRRRQRRQADRRQSVRPQGGVNKTSNSGVDAVSSGATPASSPCCTVAAPSAAARLAPAEGRRSPPAGRTITSGAPSIPTGRPRHTERN